MKYSPRNIAVIGGDLRQLSLAESLAGDGHSVRIFAMERQVTQHSSSNIRCCIDLRQALEAAQCVVLPLPVCDEQGKLNTPFSSEVIHVDDILTGLRRGTIVAAGRVPEALYDRAAKLGLLLADYLEREEFAVANAVSTAEGALQIAMEELPITLHGARTLVIGYGRIGKLLTHQLRNLGAHVTASARKCADIAWIKAYGYDALQTEKMEGRLSSFDVIFNTVPFCVLSREALESLKNGCLCIDLASKPGGIDFQAARELGIRAIWALSLPGKVAPVTSGEIIKNTVYNMLEENGVLGWEE